MARIRTIKPEFWADEKLAPLEPITRLVFLGLISQADDAGRLVESVRMIDGLLFPMTDHSSRESLETLWRTRRIIRYVSNSGQRLIQIAKWEDHQRVDNPSKYNLPGPNDAGSQIVEPPEDTESSGESSESLDRPSREPRETVERSSRSDLGSTTSDLGSTTMDHTRSSNTPREEPDCGNVDNSDEGQDRGASPVRSENGSEGEIDPAVFRDPWVSYHDDRGPKIPATVRAVVPTPKLGEYLTGIARAGNPSRRDRIWQACADIRRAERSGTLTEDVQVMLRKDLCEAINSSSRSPPPESP